MALPPLPSHEDDNIGSLVVPFGEEVRQHIKICKVHKG